MKIVPISSERSYNIEIGREFTEAVQELSRDRARIAVIFSESMKEVIPVFESQAAEFFYFAIPDGESGKSIRTLEMVWNWLGAAGFTRSDLIVGIGGGAVTDFSGYAAASWLRGIDWVAVPTTVAGMVDAAIGGKTGINSDYGKNLIGAFHSPIKVVIDFAWLTSLTDRDFAAGLAEVIKCGFIADPEILSLVEDMRISHIRDSEELTHQLIERAVRVKAAVVTGDFRESFDREILNYGHTFGHAVELHSQYSLRHGECVSIGMAFIAHLSHDLGLISRETRDQHMAVLSRLGLPISYQSGSWPELYAAMKMDKKSRGNSLRFVAISEPGSTQRLEAPSEAALIAAYEKVSQ
jgi:3-dehydroquinate synthase